MLFRSENADRLRTEEQTDVGVSEGVLCAETQTRSQPPHITPMDRGSARVAVAIRSRVASLRHQIDRVDRQHDEEHDADQDADPAACRHV